MFGIIILMISGTVFFIDYILKFLPIIMSDMIMEKFSLNILQMSWFISMYMYPYSFMQLFVGLITDKLGLYISSLMSLFLCMVGTLLMASEISFAYLMIGRILIGIGASFCIANGAKITTEMIEPQYRNLAFGAFVSFGILGGVSGFSIASQIIEYISLRSFLIYLFLILFSIFIIMSILLRNYHKNSVSKPVMPIKTIMTNIMNDKFINLSLFSAITFSALIVISSWGKEFLQEYHGINLTQSQNAISIMLFGSVIGSTILGYISSFFTNYRLILSLFSIVNISLLSILCIFKLSYFTLLMILSIFGIISSIAVVAISLAREKLHDDMSGTASSISNFINTICEAIFVNITGLLIYYIGSEYNIITIFIALSLFLISILFANRNI